MAPFRARSAATCAVRSSSWRCLRARERCAERRLDSLRLRFLSSVTDAGTARGGAGKAPSSDPADDGDVVTVDDITPGEAMFLCCYLLVVNYEKT
ncbi:hypothetical protein EJB05_15849, partial [Eragrostis curvula]